MQIRCIGSIMMISMGSAEPMDFENIIKQMQEKETLELRLFLKNRQNEELFIFYSI